MLDWARSAGRRVRRWSARSAAVAAGLLVVFAGGCTWQAGALQPKGPAAERLYEVFLISFWTGLAVYVIVGGLVLIAMFRRRRADEDAARFPTNRFVFIGGLLVPAVILMGMMGATFLYLAQEPQSGELPVTVIGHQYWWEVHYPEHDVITANEIQIPTGTDVEFRFESVDVIHSFWVPELHGKSDLVPGRTTRLVVRADEPGRYRGQCAEYCGLQHANMAFEVVAVSPEDFRTWAEAQARPAVVDDPRGEELFERHACAACHAIRGTDADGQIGPDLTHLASRAMLGAGTVPNDRGHLSGWVVNSQTIKPGNEMPPITTLEPDELHALLDYLESLQ
ncbi:MAG: cytochrome c oxidase subunit II [Actinomycetota bacterium]|nr:cytochrome c oxidase subunit II [Actinomycetota bacterium]